MMVLSLLTLTPGKVTRQVRLVPWSCGRGLTTILEADGPSTPGLKTAPLQETAPALGCSQAHTPGREHRTWLGRPASRGVLTWMSGVWVSAGERETVRR